MKSEHYDQEGNVVKLRLLKDDWLLEAEQTLGGECGRARRLIWSQG